MEAEFSDVLFIENGILHIRQSGQSADEDHDAAILAVEGRKGSADSLDHGHYWRRLIDAAQEYRAFATQEALRKLRIFSRHF